MATDEGLLEGEIADAVATLCERTDSKYVNVFDKSTLQDLARPAGRERYIVPIGPYAFHEWKREADVILVIMSRGSWSILWQLLEEELLLPSKPLANKSELEISAHSFSMTTNWEPSILAKFEALSRKNKGRCKFYLRYCQLPATFGSFRDFFFPPYDLTHDQNPQPSAILYSNLCLVRDMQYIAGAVQLTGPINLAQPTLFRAMYSKLRQWAQNCGVYSDRFGFLNSECITWVVYQALSADGAFEEGRTIDQVDEDRQFRAVLEFFRSLSERNIDSKGEPRRELQIATPQERIVSKYLTPDKLNAIKLALRMTDLADLSLHPEYQSQLHMFLSCFEHYLKVDFSSWETSQVQLADFEDNFIPSAIGEITSHLRHKHSGKHNAAGLHIRLWPKPLAENEHEHRSIYAIGISRSPNGQGSQSEPMDRYSSRIAVELSDTVSTLPAPSASLTIVSSATGEELMSIVQVAGISDDARAPAGSSKLAQRAGEPTVSTSRFRTAAEAISRLRHDPVHAAVQYDIGYEDRFEGLVWMGLENWGSWATEDENFVAEHRVRVLKRRNDGLVVWDRKNRADLTGM